ncbi:MAG: hypothetical protein IJ767_04190 [Bacteroidaceae bacterium]|nr:hypothetical protein [Bacteroidaceae bacterium]
MRIISFSDQFGLTLAVKSGSKTMTRRKTKYEIGQELGVSERYQDIYERIEDEEGIAAAIDFAQRVLIAHGKDPHDARAAARLAGWRNKMYVKADLMPTHIVITDRREEPLQCISDEDCLKEGIYERKDVIAPGMERVVCYAFDGTPHVFRFPREAFAALINKISGKGTWERNESQYAYTFKLTGDEG